MSAAPLLETRALCRSFGALAAARDIDFQLEAGARHALIGPNGAGKTTFINLLTGVVRPTAGSRAAGSRVVIEAAGTAEASRALHATHDPIATTSAIAAAPAKTRNDEPFRGRTTGSIEALGGEERWDDVDVASASAARVSA